MLRKEFSAPGLSSTGSDWQMPPFPGMHAGLALFSVMGRRVGGVLAVIQSVASAPLDLGCVFVCGLKSATVHELRSNT